jgi:hypothetical protein
MFPAPFRTGLRSSSRSAGNVEHIYQLLGHADVPDITALIAPRRVLFCQARDNKALNSHTLAARSSK